MQMGQVSAEPHKLGPPDATPRSASTVRFPIGTRVSFAPTYLLTSPLGRVRKLAKRRVRETREFVGSTPTAAIDVTNEKGLLVQREDTYFAHRKSEFDSPAVH